MPDKRVNYARELTWQMEVWQSKTARDKAMFIRTISGRIEAMELHRIARIVAGVF
jgi:hypothetical protein